MLYAFSKQFVRLAFKFKSAPEFVFKVVVLLLVLSPLPLTAQVALSLPSDQRMVVISFRWVWFLFACSLYFSNGRAEQRKGRKRAAEGSAILRSAQAGRSILPEQLAPVWNVYNRVRIAEAMFAGILLACREAEVLIWLLLMLL